MAAAAWVAAAMSRLTVEGNAVVGRTAALESRDVNSQIQELIRDGSYMPMSRPQVGGL